MRSCPGRRHCGHTAWPPPGALTGHDQPRGGAVTKGDADQHDRGRHARTLIPRVGTLVKRVPLREAPVAASTTYDQQRRPTQLTLRTRPDFERFFDGLEMVEPGVVPLPEWHGPGSEYPIPCYAGMGRKP